MFSVLFRVPETSKCYRAVSIWSAKGTEIEIVGEAMVSLILDGRRISTHALLSPDVEEIISGADWFQEHKCVWDFGRCRLYIDGQDGCALTEAPVGLSSRLCQGGRSVPASIAS